MDKHAQRSNVLQHFRPFCASVRLCLSLVFIALVALPVSWEQGEAIYNQLTSGEAASPPDFKGLPPISGNIYKRFWTDETYTVGGTSVRILGVTHTWPVFEQFGQYVLDAIGDADVVMLERTSNQPMVDGPPEPRSYFDILAGYGAERRKPTLYIDTRRDIETTVAFVATVISIVVGISAAMRFADRRAWVYLQCTSVLASLFMFPSFSVAAECMLLNPQAISAPPWVELSNIEDGFTLLMNERIEKVAALLPQGSKVVVIVGDLHARWHSAYRNSPKLRAIKLRVAEALHGWRMNPIVSVTKDSGPGALRLNRRRVADERLSEVVTPVIRHAEPPP